MFESGKWKDEDDSDDDDDDAWNLEKLRRETDAVQSRKEEERLAALYGPSEPLPAVEETEEANATEESGPTKVAGA